MLCQKCGKNNATSHLHTVVNGVVNDSYLCSECAAKLQTGSFGENSIYNMLSSFFDQSPLEAVSTERCECCGATLREISKTGKVGCGNCSKVFGTELAPTLIRIHGRTSHIGKRPDGVSEAAVVSEGDVKVHKSDGKIEKLRAELKAAIESEQYERAAEIRDEIKGLEGDE